MSSWVNDLNYKSTIAILPQNYLNVNRFTAFCVDFNEKTLKSNKCDV